MIQADRGNLFHAEALGCEQAAMACDNDSLRVNKNGLREAELLDGSGDLVDLLLRMQPGVSLIGF